VADIAPASVESDAGPGIPTAAFPKAEIRRRYVLVATVSGLGRVNGVKIKKTETVGHVSRLAWNSEIAS